MIEVRAMAETRRGRISHAVYIRTVGQMLTRDWFALESCEILTQLEVIDHLVAANPRQFPSPGWAVRELLDKAIQQVIAASRASSNAHSQLITDFLEARMSGQTVSAIAREWGLSRERVSRTFSRQAVYLVTEKTLKMGRRKLAVQRSENHQSQAVSKTLVESGK
jgi:DNA-binding phage protein